MLGGDASAGPGSRNVSRLLIFTRNGKLSLAALKSTKVTQVEKHAPMMASTADIAQGQKICGTYCMICHGVGVVSGGVMPELRNSSAGTMTAIKNIVIDGALSPLGMPSFADSITEMELKHLRADILFWANEHQEKTISAPDKSSRK